jgi:vacuolar-type H+-ATPase subunit E/Vma4
MPIKDPEKRREYRRMWYALNNESERAHVSRRKKEIKKWFIEYKESLKCIKCGENHPATLDFHHKNRKDKLFGINTKVHAGYSIDKIKKEIEKCEVLCANCHRKLHYKTAIFKRQ